MEAESYTRRWKMSSAAGLEAGTVPSIAAGGYLSSDLKIRLAPWRSACRWMKE